MRRAVSSGVKHRRVDHEEPGGVEVQQSVGRGDPELSCPRLYLQGAGQADRYSGLVLVTLDC